MIARALTPRTMLAGAAALAMAAHAQTTDPQRVEITDALVRSRAASTASKMDVPDRDIPQSIEVRDRDFIRDIGGPIRADSTADTVAGVHKNWTGNGGSDVPFLTLRGFANTAAFLQNGYRRTGNYFAVLDSSNLDRVEYLKGPASVLYGQTGSLGGAVNYVSKRPTGERSMEFDASLGSWNYAHLGLDTAGVFDETKRVAWRVNLAGDRGDSFRRYAEHDTWSVAPSFALRLGKDDELVVLTDFYRSTQRSDFGIPITPLYAQIDRRAYLQEPSYDHAKASAADLLVEYAHRFDKDWKLTVGLSANRTDWRQRYAFPQVDATVDPPVVIRQPNTERGITRDLTIEPRLEGRFKALGVEHQLQIGLSLESNRSDYSDYTVADNLPALPLLGPYTYGGDIVNVVDQGGGISKVRTWAPYVQDLVTLTPQWKLMLGARYDRRSQRDDFFSWFGQDVHDTQVDSKVSPRIGAVWQPTAATSLYASYTTSFNPNLGLDRSGRRFDPELGVQHEVGLKQMLGDDLNVNLALYQITKRNVLTTDPADPRFSIQTGAQRSRGFEIDLNGRVTPALRVNLAYAHLFLAEIIEDNTIPVGTRLVDAPTHSLHAQLVYALPGGWEVGGALDRRGITVADMPNSTWVSGSLQVDLMAAYTFHKDWKAQVNLKNLTDRHNYYTGGAGYITPGTPRALYLSLNGKF